MLPVIGALYLKKNSCGIAEMTCEDFLGFEDRFKPKFVYWV
jgi:hypothetical protein